MFSELDGGSDGRNLPAPAEPKRLRNVLRELHARGLVEYPKGSRAGVCITSLGLEALRGYGTD